MTLAPVSDPFVPAPRDRRRPRWRPVAHEPDVEPQPGITGPEVVRPPLGLGPIPPRRSERDVPSPPVPVDDEVTDVVRARATALVRTMVEVLAGRRPPAHLTGVARPEVVRYLAAGRPAVPGRVRAADRAGPTGRSGPATDDRGRAGDPGGVTGPRRVHVFRPGPDAAEIVAVCRFGPRFRALTIRMDRTPALDRNGTDRDTDGWRATAVRLL